MFEAFRKSYPELGVVLELIIANVIVGNVTMNGAYRMADELKQAVKEGRLK
jgi:hypothetical protein